MKEGNHIQAVKATEKRNQAIAKAPRLKLQRDRDGIGHNNVLLMSEFVWETGRITKEY